MSGDGISPDPAKTSTLRSMHAPTTPTTPTVLRHGWILQATDPTVLTPRSPIGPVDTQAPSVSLD